MCKYFKTETDAPQNMIDDFFIDPSIGMILSEINIGVRGYFLKKGSVIHAEHNERAEAATSSYSVEVDFLQYIYSVLLAKNH